MKKENTDMILLASASPRRKQLLESAGLSLQIEAADIDETRHPDELPVDFVQRMAREKARSVAAKHKQTDNTILAADTIVVHAGEILGKPHDIEDAKRMLRLLSGDVHSVYTGVCVIDQANDREQVFFCETKVHFCELSEAQIDWYIGTGEPMDKAGSYGIQGKAACFVKEIQGSYTNVVGLPLCETLEALSYEPPQLSKQKHTNF